MPNLPVELCSMVVEEIKSRKDLCSIRAVNRTFHALATPKVFHTLYLCGSLRALSYGRGIMRDFAPCVTKLFYNGCRGYFPGEYYHSSSKDRCICECLCGRHCKNVCECPNSPAFTHEDDHTRQTFTLVHKLSSLKKLALTFDSDPEYTDIQRIVIESLVQQPLSTNIDTLVLNNLHPDFFNAYNNPEFYDLISQLSYLKITIRARKFNSLENPLWGRAMEDAIFLPCSVSGRLTSLTLACKSTWYPSVPPFSTLELPNLTYLSLTRFMFDDCSGIDKFIIEHGETIRTLKLILCPLLIIREPSSGDALTTWKEVFEPMAAALEHVLKLTLKTGATGYISDMAQAYVEKTKHGVEFMDDHELPANCVDDWLTLQDFREAVEARVGGHYDYDGNSDEEDFDGRSKS